jgi:hypothetical protein
MPLHECIALLLTSLAFASLAALRIASLRARLQRPVVWAGMVVAASAMSALSGLAARTGHAGTGFVTRHGWPKPYLFRFVAEDGAQTVGFEWLYFAGNAMAYAAGLLALLVVSSAVRWRRPPGF